MNKEVRKGLLRHKFVYHFLRILIGWLIAKIRNFSYTYKKIKGKPVLILANHNSDFDPLLMVISMKKHFKFVASANIMSGPVGKMIGWLSGPIPREKGASTEKTIELILENLAAGIDVAMFPEGNKSWDGSTCFISKRTAKILKEVNCGLVTYRFDGEYLASPRWAKYPRKGKVYGRIISEYSSEQLKELSIDEIYDIIVNDLNADAYEYQNTHHIRYEGKALAEGIEKLAYLCPLCHKFDTIQAQGDELACSCGLRAVYDEYGYLQGNGLKDHDTTIKWNSFQKNWLKRHSEQLKKQTKEPFSKDKDLCLYRIIDNERVLLNRNVRSDIYGDRFVLDDGNGFVMEFPWKKISKIGMFRNNRLYMTFDGGRYELYRPEGFSLLKYFSLHRVLTDKELL